MGLCGWLPSLCWGGSTSAGRSTGHLRWCTCALGMFGCSTSDAVCVLRCSMHVTIVGIAPSAQAWWSFSGSGVSQLSSASSTRRADQSSGSNINVTAWCWADPSPPMVHHALHAVGCTPQAAPVWMAHGRVQPAQSGAGTCNIQHPLCNVRSRSTYSVVHSCTRVPKLHVATPKSVHCSNVCSPAGCVFATAGWRN